MEAPFITYFSSPIGLMEINSTDTAITTVSFVETKDKASSFSMPDCLKECVEQLDEYFKGARKAFTIPILLEGTSFQQQVWSELENIPFGKTTSYLTLARKLNNPNAMRAIGNTNSKNKICILLPCHRVIGHDGSMVGYAGGVWRKKWLLAHEQTYSGYQQMKLF
jgi:methylated-DNA-[protein]-cysteine S-methyltransferase